ncbi:MAG: hypothetical protein ACRERX_01830 [Pseudomonas sp.]
MRRFYLSVFAVLALPHGALAEGPAAKTPQADGYGVLIISRERLEVANPCDIGLYLQDQLAARLYQGQAVSFNLPPGPVWIRLGLVGPGICQPGISQVRGQSINLRAGEVRKYRIALSTEGLYLLAAPGSR